MDERFIGWPRFVWKLVRNAHFGADGGGDGGGGAPAEGGGDPGSVGAGGGGDPGAGVGSDGTGTAPSFVGTAGTGAGEANAGTGTPTAGPGAPTGGGGGIPGIGGGDSLTQAQQAEVDAINTGTFSPSQGFNFGADVGRAVANVNPDTLSGAAPGPPGFEGPVSTDPAVLAAAGLGNVPGFPSVAGDTTPLTAVSVPAVTGTPAAIGAPGAPDIGSIGQPAATTPTGTGSNGLAQQAGIGDIGSGVGSLPATANDPFGLESGGIVPGIGADPGFLGTGFPGTSINTGPTLTGGNELAAGDLGPFPGADPPTIQTGGPPLPGGAPGGTTGTPGQDLNLDNLTIQVGGGEPSNPTSPAGGGGDLIRLLGAGGAGGAAGALSLGGAGGAGVFAPAGGIEQADGSVSFPDGTVLAPQQIAQLQQQQDALLQQWQTVIPPTDPRWPQVIQMVQSQVWGSHIAAENETMPPGSGGGFFNRPTPSSQAA